MLQETPYTLPEGDPLKLDVFLDELALRQQARLGAVKLGPGERLKALHLAQVMVYERQTPEALPGALKAALTSNEEESALFETAWAEAPNWHGPELDTAFGRTRRSGPSYDEQTERPGAKHPDLAEDAETEEGFDWQDWRVWLSAGSVVLLVALGVLALIMTRPPEPVIDDPVDFEEIGPDPLEISQGVQQTAEIGPPPDSEPSESLAIAPDLSELERERIQRRAQRLIALAEPFQQRPTVRQYSQALADTAIIIDGRDSFTLTRQLAKATGISPDSLIDFTRRDTLSKVYPVAYEPVEPRLFHSVWFQSFEGRVTFLEGSASPDTGFADAISVTKAVEGPDRTVTIEDGVIEYRQLSPDATRLITIGPDGLQAALWNAENGELIARLGDSGLSVRPKFSPDGAWVFTESLSQSELIVWDTDTGSEVSRMTVVPNADRTIISAEFSSDSFRIFVRSDADSGEATLAIWPILGSGGPTVSIDHPGSLVHAALSEDGMRILTLDDDNIVRLWSGYDGDLIGTLATGEEDVLALAFTPDSQRVIIVSDEAISHWDSLIGEERTRFPLVRRNYFEGLATAPEAIISADQKRVFTTHYLGPQRMVRQGIQAEEFNPKQSGERISSTRELVLALWDLGTGELLRSVEVSNYEVAIPNQLIIYNNLPEWVFWDITSDEAPFEVSLGPASDFGGVHISLPSATEQQTQATRDAIARQDAAARPAWPAWLMALIPLFVVAIILLHPERWRRDYLKGKTIDSGTFLRRLAHRRKPQPLLMTERRAAQRLDQRQRVPSHRMDANATAIATAKANGVFSPIMDTDAGSARYVVLIERRRRTDADATRLIAFFKRLKRAGLHLDLYTWSGTPEAVTPLSGTRRSISLPRLRQRHRGAFLLIAGDAGSVYDYSTGEAARWTHQLGHIGSAGSSDWSGGAFLSRISDERAAYGEAVIEKELALELKQASAADLEALAGLFHDGKAMRAHQSSASIEPVPEYFAKRPERLVRGQPPSEIDQAMLIAELSDWLGKDGLIWVQSLAYFPVVEWEVARHLADALIGHLSPAQRDALERDVARLPWLEHGVMPEWVRARLIADVPKEMETDIVEVLTTLLDQTGEAESGDVVLDVIDPAGNVQAIRAGDAIFIDALARTRARPWDLPPPAKWREWMPELFQTPWPRLRILLAGLGLAIAAWWLTPKGIGVRTAEWLPVFVLGVSVIAMWGLMRLGLRTVGRRF